MCWLAKHKIAHSMNYESLLEVAVSLGSTYMTELHQGDNAKYTSQQSMFNFISVLSWCIEQKINAELNHSNNVSLLCNETTAVSITKQLIIYVQEGGLRVRYLKTRDMKDGIPIPSTIHPAIMELVLNQFLCCFSPHWRELLKNTYFCPLPHLPVQPRISLLQICRILPPLWHRTAVPCIRG